MSYGYASRRGGGGSNIQSYSDAEFVLNGRNRRKVANNTYLERRSKTVIAIRLHSTDIVTFTTDHKAYLDTGGWNTLTTRSRMNRFLPDNWSVGTDRGTLYLYQRIEDGSLRYAWDGGPMIDISTNTTDAPLKPKRTHRPHTNPECQCAGCSARRDAGEYRNRWLQQGQSHVEDVTTPEDTATEATIPDGVDGERWSDYNRKFNALLMRKEVPA